MQLSEALKIHAEMEQLKTKEATLSPDELVEARLDSCITHLEELEGARSYALTLNKAFWTIYQDTDEAGRAVLARFANELHLNLPVDVSTWQWAVDHAIEKRENKAAEKAATA
jgi:hypothetical protein